MSSRRQFLKTSSMAFAGVVLASSCGPAIVSGKTKVIIIGGGFAGLSAAYEMHKRGIDFEILESRNEVGGRVLSKVIDPQSNLVVELGAEWIGEDHILLRGLCEELGITYLNNQFDTQVIYNGLHYKSLSDIVSPGWDATYKNLIATYKALSEEEKEKLGRVLDREDWWRYLVDRGCSGVDLDIRELADSTDFGESIRFVSAYAALEEYSRTSENSRNEMDYKMVGGNQQLAYKLIDLFPQKIRYEHTVLKVHQSDKVRVHCSNGYIAEGDKLICTAPTFAVKKIVWDPLLPEDMASAMNQLQYARINKHTMLFGERFWNEESFDMITDMPGHYFYHATKNQNSMKGALTSYTIGDKAAVFANQSNEVNADIVASSLHSAFPDVKRLMERQMNYYWGNNDFSKGAYAMYGKGQWFDLFPKLNQTHLHTHFAGEHLSEYWQGFMEGALETGKAAAEKI